MKLIPGNFYVVKEIDTVKDIGDCYVVAKLLKKTDTKLYFKFISKYKPYPYKVEYNFWIYLSEVNGDRFKVKPLGVEEAMAEVL